MSRRINPPHYSDVMEMPRVSRTWLTETIERSVSDAFIDHDIEEIVKEAVRAELRSLLPEIVAALKSAPGALRELKTKEPDLF